MHGGRCRAAASSRRTPRRSRCADRGAALFLDPKEILMPLVTLTVRQGRSAKLKTTVLDAVHAALIESGVPAADLFQRVFELSAADFRYDAGYPDVKTARNDDFALVEILWSVGRSVKVKKKLLADLMATLARAGLDPENVMVCFKETTWENWAFAGGRLIHAP
jgi:phenylpyruvate tautomerase PptA (4-oxalocrotonate tautomerase family)